MKRTLVFGCATAAVLLGGCVPSLEPPIEAVYGPAPDVIVDESDEPISEVYGPAPYDDDESFRADAEMPSDAVAVVYGSTPLG